MNRLFGALYVILLTCAVMAAPAPQPFAPGWGRPLDPDKDCNIRSGKEALSIQMPGTDHNFDKHRARLNAPRLLRILEGDFDIRVRVRIDGHASHESTVKGEPSYISAGFLVIPPETFAIQCIRLEYRVLGQGDGVEGCATEITQDVKGGGMRGGGWDKRWREWPFKAKPEYVYQRLDREGQALGYYISSDGKKWVTLGGGLFLGLPRKITVGLAACTTSRRPSKVQFDQLKLARGKQKD